MFAAVRQLLAATALMLSAASPAWAMPADARLYLDAAAGNTVSHELPAPVIWQHGTDGSFSSVSRASEGVAVFFDSGSLTWLFQFSAPGLTEALRVGRYDHLGATGDPLVSSPFGMIPQWSGWFDVLEIDYNDSGSLDRFAVDFHQFDGLSQSGPAVFGSLRYNSSLALARSAPVEVPEPGSAALLLGALALLGAATRRSGRGRR